MNDFIKNMVEGRKCDFHPEEDAIDCYTPYGRAEDYEPPATVFLCQNCVEEDKAFLRRYEFMPSRWLKADYEIELAKELGYHCEKGVWVKNEA